MPYELAIELSIAGHKQYIPLEGGITKLEAGEKIVVDAGFTTSGIAADNYTAAITMRSGYLYHQLISKEWPVEVRPNAGQ